MSRIIKFRVWDKINSKFLNDPPWCVMIFTGQVLIKENVMYNEVGEKTNFCLQQFTGLLDKNSKEIYEGDIVSVHTYEDWNDEIGYDTVVYFIGWCNVHAGWRGFNKKMVEAKYSGIELLNPITVLSNIFENPELLE